MNLIIVGVGKVGETLVENLINENHDITVVDSDVEKVASVVNRYDVNGIVGSGLESVALADAGVEKTDFFIACTSRDEVNILSCVLAKKLGAKRTIARVRDPEYVREMENMRENLGVDFFFNPEFQTAVEIAEVFKFPSAKKVESFASGRASMIEFTVLGDNPLIGKSLMQISKEYANKVLIGMVERGSEVIIPRGDFMVKKGDSVHIIGAEQEIASFTKKVKLFKRRAKSVFVIGGGRIGYYLAKLLLDAGASVKIVEKDEKRAMELSENLPKAVVLSFDGTDHEALDEEKLKDSDALVSLTGIDEENVIVSLYAKEQGVEKVVAKVDRPSILNMVKTLGLDTAVSPRKVIANHIVRFVRANRTVNNSGIITLYKLHDKVEAVEFSVGEDFKHTGISLKELPIKRGVLVGGIVRDKEFILPTGDTKLAYGDRVIIVTSVKHITGLRQILK
ncbi:MAG: Trk system potassium transporter TrkA [Clostridia bacterium]|nr:Trk system potassium transporter TrkA [Clostridia bacterium]